MKNKYIIFLLLFLTLMLFSMKGRSSNDNLFKSIDAITSSFNSSRTHQLIPFMDDMVTVTIKNNSRILSKNQAHNLIKEFIDKNGKGVLSIDKMGNDPQMVLFYCLGNLQIKNKQFVIYLLMKKDKVKDVYYLKEIKID